MVVGAVESLAVNSVTEDDSVEVLEMRRSGSSFCSKAQHFCAAGSKPSLSALASTLKTLMSTEALRRRIASSCALCSFRASLSHAHTRTHAHTHTHVRTRTCTRRSLYAGPPGQTVTRCAFRGQPNAPAFAMHPDRAYLRGSTDST
eukprot:GHVU01032996.1.p1 GENE.GHVU01032996.1~~GHVU01032996.1.p1  ORF type:complete len:146 (-),score=2.68 GHVU01032996.1:1095-1532(-)